MRSSRSDGVWPAGFANRVRVVRPRRLQHAVLRAIHPVGQLLQRMHIVHGTGRTSAGASPMRRATPADPAWPALPQACGKASAGSSHATRNPGRPRVRTGRGFDSRTDVRQDKGHPRVALVLSGGAGGNRTRVRKSSTGSSTCLAGLFGFNPVLGQSAGLHVASRLGSRSASSDPMHVRSHVNGAANRGRFLPLDPTHGQVGAASSRY